MADELAKAITKVIYPALKAEGFHRARKRDLIRVENGIVHLLYFQVSGHGGRDFCVTACANLIAANEFVSLQPGFRLTRDTDGGDLWLPSHTADEAERSAQVVLGSIQAEALPYFETVRTPAGFSALLAKERWASTHHLSFHRGVCSALQDDASAAIRHLADAIQLYEADGRGWCTDYIQRATALLHALKARTAPDLLAGWFKENSKAHGVR
jgi:hypothetical protein